MLRWLGVKGYIYTIVERDFKQKRLRCFINKVKMVFIKYNIRLFFWLLFSKFDAVCSIDLDSIMVGYFSTRLRRKKLVYDAHELFTELPELIDRPTKAMWSAIERKIIPKVDLAYTVCDSLMSSSTI